jgi:hypothetical protein
MVDTLLRQVALVSESEQIDPSDLTRVSAALQKQVTRDLVQFWDVKATVDAFPQLEDVPIGYWPIIIKDNIGFNAAGIHLDKDHQPFALVTASKERDVWSLTTSHELIEMVVDPFGNRLMAGDSPKPDQTRVQFLVEACDPPEADEFAYTVNGILVSDFYSVRFFDPVAAPGVRYSFTGAIRQPREVLRGGYLSWLDVASDDWWQETWFSGNRPTFRNLGQMNAANGSFRTQIDRLTSEDRSRAMSGGLRAARAAGLPATETDRIAAVRAARLRQQIDDLTSRGSGRNGDSGEAESMDRAKPIGTAAKWRSGERGSAGKSSVPAADADELRAAPAVWDR